MDDGSVIDVLGRYRRGKTQDPVENKLTAAVAALLMNSEELANRVAGHYLSGDWQPTSTIVRMQRPIGEPGWVDLELDVRNPRRAMIWIEAKYGSRPDNSQLKRYADSLRRFQLPEMEQVLLLLAPASAQPTKLPPLENRTSTRLLRPYFTTWEDLYECLSTPTKPGGARTWLHKEVLDYMAKRVRYADRVQPKHIKAMEHREDAQEILQSLVSEIGYTFIKAKRRQKSERWQPNRGYWEYNYPVRLGAGKRYGGKALLHWNLAPPYLTAGVRFNTPGDGAIKPGSDGVWASALLATDRLPPGSTEWGADQDSEREHTWVVCSADLRSVLGDGKLDEQVQRAVEFIESTFSIACSVRDSQ